MKELFYMLAADGRMVCQTAGSLFISMGVLSVGNLPKSLGLGRHTGVMLSQESAIIAIFQVQFSLP